LILTFAFGCGDNKKPADKAPAEKDMKNMKDMKDMK